MATTLDGYRLGLGCQALKGLLGRLRESGLRDLVRAHYRGGMAGAVARAVAELAAGAYRSGVLRDRGGQAFAVFTAQARGQTYHLVARAAGAATFEVLSVRRRGGEAELSDGYGHRVVQNMVVDLLRAQGLDLATDNSPLDYGIRDNRGQVSQAGVRIKGNMPDVSYVDARGRRVNVEIDTDGKKSLKHEAALIHNDDQAMHIFAVVDPRTGEIKGTRVYDPALGKRPAVPGGRTLDLPPPARKGRPRVPPKPAVRIARQPARRRAGASREAEREAALANLLTEPQSLG
jgi:hypothetical protein